MPWERGLDLNQRPSGYEPDELPDCSTQLHQWLRAASAALAIYTLLALGVQPAQAQNDPASHMRYHHYYRTWKQPGSEVGCCNARQYIGAHPVTGDCEPTQATIRNGQWYAKLPRAYSQMGDANGEIPIPDAKVIRERNPSVEEGHLCWQPDVGVLCFVPPDVGG